MHTWSLELVILAKGLAHSVHMKLKYLEGKVEGICCRLQREKNEGQRGEKSEFTLFGPKSHDKYKNQSSILTLLTYLILAVSAGLRHKQNRTEIF